MADRPSVTFTAPDIDAIAGATGEVAIIVPENGKLDVMGRAVRSNV